MIRSVKEKKKKKMTRRRKGQKCRHCWRDSRVNATRTRRMEVRMEIGESLGQSSYPFISWQGRSGVETQANFFCSVSNFLERLGWAEGNFWKPLFLPENYLFRKVILPKKEIITPTSLLFLKRKIIIPYYKRFPCSRHYFLLLFLLLLLLLLS